MIGTRVSHYRIVRAIGAGGMGVVYLAEDEHLNRKVALKFLPPAIAHDRDARVRLRREAQAASALDHPNVATVHDIDEWNGQLFIAMPYYEGETLRQRIDRASLSVEEAVRIAGQIAAGLAATHRAGLVHRDLKPGNIILTNDGQVKILDFGLAKSLSDPEAAMTRMTQAGTAVGTIAYMAPEQATGADVDARADVWALGVTLYEMLTGGLPFAGKTAPVIMLALTSQSPLALAAFPANIPEVLSALVKRALEKDVTRRTISAEDMRAAIAEWQTSRSAGVPVVTSTTVVARRWRPAIAGVVIVAVALVGLWLVRQNMRTRWSREQALPQIEQLSEHEDYIAAYRLMLEAKQYIPNDPVWKRIDPIVSRTVTVKSTLVGVLVSYRPIGSQNDWIRLGLSPIESAVIPNGYLEWRFEKAGYVTASDATTPAFAGTTTMLVTLHTADETPADMVYVTTGNEGRVALITLLDHLPPRPLRDFWIDRYEVTNRQFKRFVDAGGYKDPKYWRYPFAEKGRALTFADAMTRLVDSTGRPGPSTWESGNFLDGQDELPVSGVSWYEAAAYAEFAGKSLPTIFHWSRVADQRMSGVVAPRSNFQGHGPMKVGTSGGVNRFGAFDLAGNVKEWCWNPADESKRYILGGAWDEPAYMFNDPDARSPFERAANFGFRCIKYSNDDPAPNATELVAFGFRDFRKEKPASDQAFAVYKSLYAYDARVLEARVESSDDSNTEWRVERVSFTTAYGNERVPALVYLPKQATPPYQTVIYFPGSGTISQRSSALINTRAFDWIIRSGRVLVHPIYKSTFERGDDIMTDYPDSTNTFREHVIAWAKDVERTVDYLLTRPDVDHSRLGYLGFSWGAAMSPIYLAVEPRFKAAVLVVGGFYMQRSAPEVEAINFAPRVKLPLLMLNGRFDFFYPEDAAQLPMFRLFGGPESDKRRVVYDTSHNIPRPDLIRESLDWFDKYLGRTK